MSRLAPRARPLSPAVVLVAVLALVAAITGVRQWRGGADLVDAGGARAAVAEIPERLFLPRSAPPGFAINAVADGLHEGKPATSRTSTVTLYGDAEAADPLTRPLLAVIWNEGSDSRSGPPGSGNGEFRDVKIQGHRGVAGLRHGDAWATFFPPDDDQEADSTSVLGRGFSEEEVRRAAESARARQGSASIEADGLPAGVQALTTGSVQLEDPVPSPAVHVEYKGAGGASYSVTVAKGGEDLAHLARLSVRGEQRPVRGGTGSVGTPVFDPGPGERTRYAWREDGHVIVVTGWQVPPESVATFVDSLESVDATATLPGLKKGLADYPPESMLRPGEVLAVSGRSAEGAWAVGVSGRGPTMTMSQYAIDAGDFVGGGGGSWREGQFGTTTGSGGDYLWIVGSAPDDVVRVDIELPGRPPVTADVGRAKGYRGLWFGTWLPVEEAVRTYYVVGYDAANHEVLRKKAGA
jgi:hypothetical protein